MDLLNQSVLVLGAGVSGKAAAKMLRSHNADVRVYDDNDNNQVNLDGVKLCVVSPGVPISHKIISMLRKRQVKIMSELELGASVMECDIIAITGTNGKTTTTLLVAEMLKNAGFNAIKMGNIGEPVTTYAPDIKEEDIAVIEVSSFQLETTNYFKPKVAAALNVAPDHLDRHGSYQEYIRQKLRLFQDMDISDRAVINHDYPLLKEFSLGLKIPVTPFSMKEKVKGVFVENGNIYYEGYVTSIEDIAMKERCNIENALAALAICLPYGVPPKAARDTLLYFTPPEFRMSDRGVRWNKRIINDSKGTNIHSTLAALKSLTGDTALILGGSDKGEDFTKLFNNLPACVRYILVTGENAPEIMSAADKCKFNMIMEFKQLSDCVEYVKQLNVINVLFSPASASFDRYRDYKERGKAFDDLLC